jgi:hypothetical protein
MKLGKEEIQKIVLGGMMLIAVIYGYFSLLLGPLAAKQAGARTNIAELEPKIAEAQAAIKVTESAEKDAPKALAVLGQVTALIPEGAPIAWFPPRVADFFKNRGVDKAVTRNISEDVEKDLPAFRRVSWSIDLPKVDFIAFAAALAQFENDEPLVQVTSVVVEPNHEDVQAQHAVLNVSNIVKPIAKQ